jgi:DNA topoisomerase VI subunit B
LKELVDNALDAAEEFGIAPAIQAEVADGAIIITTSLIASDGRGDGWATMTARRRTISH